MRGVSEINQFFNKIPTERREQVLNTVDWLFWGDKFNKSDGWTSRKTNQLTNQIKNLDCFSAYNYENFTHGNQEKLVFPKCHKNSVNAIFTTDIDRSVCKDFIRHLRNGIAHGRAKHRKIKNTLYIEICDYKDDSLKIQTAYILIPLDTFIRIQVLYKNVKNR